MNRLLLLAFVLFCSFTAAAQTFNSAQSHKQGAAVSQSVTADGAGAAVDTTGYSQVLVTVRGTYVVVDIAFEASPDATNYFPVVGTRVDSATAETSSGALTNTTRAWRFNVTGFTRFRINSDWTSGTASVTITPVAAAQQPGVTVSQATAGALNATVTGSVGLTGSLPAGSATIGAVNLSQYTPVSGRLPVDPSGVTSPISAASLPLPTGAATSAKQPALGTAGSASADVLTVQGVASMTPLLVNGSGVTQPVSAASLPLPTGAATETTLAALNTKINTEITADYDSGAGSQTMKLAGIALPASGGAVAGGTSTNPLRIDPTGTTTQPVSGTVNVGTFPDNEPINVAQMNGAAVTMGNGVSGSGVQRVTIASDSTGQVALAAGSNAIGSVTANAGTNLNTSALALESGGNLATVAGAVRAEDAAHASGHTGIPALAVRQDTAAQLAGTDGDYSPLITDASGRLHVNVGNTVTVSGTITANAGTGTLGTNLAQVGGTTLLTGAGNTGAGSPRVTIASDQAAIPVAQAGTWTDIVVGGVAHDASDSGAPVKIGARATNASITAVSNNDRTDLITDLNGKLINLPFSVPENFISGTTSAITGTSDTSIIAAGGAGVRNFVTQILVTNAHASVDTVVEIKSSTTVLYRGFAKSGGGGFALTFPVPLRGGSNEAINCAAVTTGSSVYCSASGYRAP